MFRETLQQIVDRADGGMAGIVMGFDGIAVESYARDEGHDIQTTGMELAHVISQVKRACESMEAGTTPEVTVKADRLTVIAHVLNEEYFVAVAVRPEGNFGKARYLMRLFVPKIKAEL